MPRRKVLNIFPKEMIDSTFQRLYDKEISCSEACRILGLSRTRIYEQKKIWERKNQKEEPSAPAPEAKKKEYSPPAPEAKKNESSRIKTGRDDADLLKCIFPSPLLLNKYLNPSLLLIQTRAAPDKYRQYTRIAIYKKGKAQLFECMKCKELRKTHPEFRGVRVKVQDGVVVGDAQPQHLEDCQLKSLECVIVTEVERQARLRVVEGEQEPIEAWKEGLFRCYVIVNDYGFPKKGKGSITDMYPSYDSIRHQFSRLIRTKKRRLAKDQSKIVNPEEPEGESSLFEPQNQEQYEYFEAPSLEQADETLEAVESVQDVSFEGLSPDHSSVQEEESSPAFEPPNKKRYLFISPVPTTQDGDSAHSGNLLFAPSDQSFLPTQTPFRNKLPQPKLPMPKSAATSTTVSGQTFRVLCVPRKKLVAAPLFPPVGHYHSGNIGPKFRRPNPL